MYQIGDQLIYGAHGVCQVVAQEEREVNRKTVIYLALEPVGQTGSRYLVPTNNAAALSKLRHMLSKEELTRLMDSREVRQDSWIHDENQRKQAYRQLIVSGDRAKLIQMVRALYRHKAAMALTGRRIHQCDDTFLRDAEKLLSSEISRVLDLTPEEAIAHLRLTLQD